MGVILLVFLLSLYYFFYTKSGVKQGYFLIGYILSVKNNLDVKVLSVDISDYPSISAQARVERRYMLDILGEYRDRKFDMHYSINSKCIESNICRIDDDVNITGSLKGHSRNLRIEGEGRLLEGEIRYTALRKKHSIEEIEVTLIGASTDKIFELMGEKAPIEGDSNATLRLSTFNKEKRRGILEINVLEEDYHGLPLHWETTINIHDYNHLFHSKISTPTAKFELVNGKYDAKNRLGNASYILDIPNALDLEELLKMKLHSPIYSTGELKYDKKVTVKGNSKSLGGNLELSYADKNLSFSLDNIPLASILDKLEAKSLFDSNISGEGYYSFEDKNLSLDATLSALHFDENKITKEFYKSFELNLSQEVFTNNRLRIKTIEGKRYSDLILSNQNNYIKLKETHLNSNYYSIESDVDIILHKYALKGALLVKIDKVTSANDTYIKFDGLVQKHYQVQLNGMLSSKWVSMDYELSSHRLPSHLVTIEDDVNITGHISGTQERLQIEGKGTALEGYIAYKATKKSNMLEDISIEMNDIHALKLSTLLGTTDIPSGRADIKADFDFISQTDKKGILNYHLKEAKYKTLPLEIDSHINIDNKTHNFKADITLADTKIKLDKGKFFEDTKYSEAFYTLDIPSVSTLKPLFKNSYQGNFYAVGQATYQEDFIIHGLSKSFEGLTEFHYEDNHLAIDLKNASFQNIISIFSTHKRLDALTTGTIDYDFIEKKFIVDTNLSHAKFLYSDVIETIYQEAGINLLEEIFHQSSLVAVYQNNLLKGNIELRNEKNHVSIRNVAINTKEDSINALFDVNIQDMALSGKIYGNLKHPKINLNMQKLVRHEMDKQLDSFVGKENREMMESMPMGDMSKDMASEVGGVFMEMFF
jgi:hypothetical protein